MSITKKDRMHMRVYLFLIAILYFVRVWKALWRLNMHELSVTESILNIVLKHAQGNGAEKVLTIGLTIGELSELVGDCIQHYFDYLSKGTIAEGATLDIERSPIVFQCSECQNTFPVSLKDTKDFACPACSGVKVTLISGREFYIKDITIS